MRSILPLPARVREAAPAPAQRAVEATPQQVAATGAALGSYGQVDPIDGDAGWRPAGSQGRQVPEWTLEKARMYSVAAYRSNPMAKAIVDTYTSFCVGDSGVSVTVTNPDVREVVDEFWTDPRNRMAALQELWLRDQLLVGESLIELMTGPISGSTRFSPIDPSIIVDVVLHKRNPLWVDHVVFQDSADRENLLIADVDDHTGLMSGQAMFWTPFKALITDRRGSPFLSTVLDWLDSYDQVLGNLIDRTALARYLVWDVTVDGDQKDVDNFVKQRGGLHVPRSGSVEVHNKSVEWEPKTAQTGAYEDTTAARSVLTLAAAGSGLSKTWLAEPEDSNRATSLTMAEPVRRRISGVQRVWMGYQTDLLHYVVDQAVAAKRLQPTVEGSDPKTGEKSQVRARDTVMVTGPEVAAADAQISAQVLMNLSVGLDKLMSRGVLSQEAAAMAARKAWEDFVGVPYRAELNDPNKANVDDVATHVDDNADGKPVGGRLHALP
ncbi:hypothetical protein SAMN04489727_1719 [Amycolatopsis tolypomycina]|uniref:Phage portal protein, SPP1 Gp6-like n=1 Tax=Amycolatopsis tolypomycina TaxID=208445 RepID=A0A1H4JB62_9PSEU|nr:hypothetical protein [Amycolatopsis tolypomycina]SEB43503.1 hypothetical protein SAMN04489727_1719 [Amycolatopsis tolypomycina]